MSEQKDKVIEQARKIIAMRDGDGHLPTTMSSNSALQVLSILIQHLDADEFRARQKASKITRASRSGPPRWVGYDMPDAASDA